MGLMDMVSQVAGQFGGEHKQQAAGGLMEELQNRPGGVGGLVQSFQQNGLGGLVSQWAGGNTAPAAPEQIEQGMGNTGIIENIAQRTGISPAFIKMGLAVAVPLVIHHFMSNGHVNEQGEQTGPQPETGGVLKSILSRLG